MQREKRGRHVEREERKACREREREGEGDREERERRREREAQSEVGLYKQSVLGIGMSSVGPLVCVVFTNPACTTFSKIHSGNSTQVLDDFPFNLYRVCTHFHSLQMCTQ